jgi:hypothetical protein
MIFDAYKAYISLLLFYQYLFKLVDELLLFRLIAFEFG